MKLLVLISIIIVPIHLYFLFRAKSEDRNKAYVLFILWNFAFMNLDTAPGGDYSFSVFNTLTYVSLPFLHFKTGSYLGKTPYAFLVTILIIALIAGAVFSQFIGNSLFELTKFVPIFIFSKILIDECHRDPQFSEKVIAVLKINVIIALIFLCCQFIFGLKFNLYNGANPNISNGAIRYPGIFQDPQKFAQFLAALSFLFLLKDQKTNSISIKNIGIFGAALIGLFLTGGRAGLLGWAFGISLLFLFGRSLYKVMGLVAAGIFIVIFMNFQDKFAVFNREESLDESYDFRFQIWKKAFKIYSDNSTLGIGIGNYQSYVAKYSQDQYWIVDDGKNLLYYDHPESGYLKFLTELGWVGFALTFSLIIIPMAMGMWLYLKIKDERLLFLTASVCSWALGFYSVYSFGDVRITIMIATLVSLLVHFTFVGSHSEVTQHEPV
jgi:hypothetical protein